MTDMPRRGFFKAIACAGFLPAVPVAPAKPKIHIGKFVPISIGYVAPTDGEVIELQDASVLSISVVSVPVDPNCVVKRLL